MEVCESVSTTEYLFTAVRFVGEQTIPEDVQGIGVGGTVHTQSADDVSIIKNLRLWNLFMNLCRPISRTRREAAARETVAATYAAGRLCGGLSRPSDCIVMVRGEAVIAPGRSSVAEGMLARQVRVSEAVYREACERLTEAIGGTNYYSGTLDFAAEGLECRLTVDAIVYRQRRPYPEGDMEEISDLVPVWWEFHTSKDGEELPNDFRFSELRKYI